MSSLMRRFHNSVAPIMVSSPNLNDNLFRRQVATHSHSGRRTLMDSFGKRFRQSMLVRHLGHAQTKCERPGCEGRVQGLFEPTGRFRFYCSDATCFMRGQEKAK